MLYLLLKYCIFIYQINGCNLGIFLDCQLLLEERVATVVRKPTACLPVVLTPSGRPSPSIGYLMVKLLQ